jgi:branched-chain amino acid transport system ATP-binding protein
LLRLSDVHAYYGDAHVLHGISLLVDEAEVVCVMGPNGAGKTTLLKVIAGAVRPRRGVVEWHGQKRSIRRPKDAVDAGIVLVPEGRHIFQTMSIRDNLLLGAYSRRDRSAVEDDISMMYEIFPVLHAKRHALGKAMSGGEQQMLAIARGLMSRPRLLLLDEPSLGLAPKIVGELPAVLTMVREMFQTAILIVEQNASLALDVASRGVMLETGRIRASGTASELEELIEREGPFVAATAGPA